MMSTNHRAGTVAGDDETVVMGRVLDDPAAATGGPGNDGLAGNGPGNDGLAGNGLAGNGLAAELAAAAPRRWWNRGTVVLATLLLAGVAFLGGAYTQQQWGQPADGQQPGRGTAGGARTGQFPGVYGGGTVPGAGQPNQNGGGTTGGATASAGSATTTGTVKLVDGKTVYLETSDGQVVTVRTTSSTVVRAAKKAKLTDLDAGDTVTVQGATAADDTVTATSLTTEPN